MEPCAILLLAAAGLSLAAIPSSDDIRITSADVPKPGKNSFYLQNREPLAPQPFLKLPLGAVKPEGWLKKQLELQADGFIGHLPEISNFLRKENNAWLSPTGAGEHGWEEVPYWLKGFLNMGYLLGDKRIMAESKIWIEGMLGSQQADGWFGPNSNRTASDGKPDMWPNMVALDCLRSYHEKTNDLRVLELMRRYFKYQLELPEENMFLSYWEKHRGGDNIASIYYLYNRTGEPWLLDVVRKIHRRTAPWDKGVPDWHGVNMAQAFREPYQLSLLTGSKEQAEASDKDYLEMRFRYGQVPGGLYGADENARYGFTDPRQAAETCAMVEMMLSHEMLLAMSGDAKWAERCEDVAFNSLPASMTEDLKALRYLTAPNHAVSDAASKAPGIQNGGPMYLMDPNDHRCCQHNVSHGWPYFTEHLWMATADNGLAAALYAPSKVTAKVGKEGREVTIHEETQYPFRDRIHFKISAGKPVAFPLTLRLPSWSSKPSLYLNGKLQRFEKGNYVRIEKEWKDGDTVELHLPMTPSVVVWKENKNSVSVNRGPLTYSLMIDEQRRRHGGNDQWPAWEILPKSAWNYGLLEESSFEVKERPWPKNEQPFAPGSSPVEIVTKGRRIPEWKLDMYGLAAILKQSPAYSVQPVEEIKLVPMGASRLRISAFPTVSAESTANRWEPPVEPLPGIPATASHKHPADSFAALTDGLEPKSSNDLLIPRFTWWDRKGTSEWVELTYSEAKKFSLVEVYWFDDERTGGGCRVPASWRVLYHANGQWHPIKANAGFGTEKDQFNTVSFEQAASKKWRIEARLKPGFSGGILEWRMK